MAPEIHEKKPYSGPSVDLFASGIILFIMATGAPPFNCAKKDERYYKMIYQGKWEMFWKFHARSKPGGEGFFSSDFK